MIGTLTDMFTCVPGLEERIFGFDRAPIVGRPPTAREGAAGTPGPPREGAGEDTEANDIIYDSQSVYIYVRTSELCERVWGCSRRTAPVVLGQCIIIIFYEVQFVFG